MQKLQQIVAQGNQITALEKDTFKLAPQVNMIALQENSLASIQTGMFDHLAFIKTIYLQKNSIAEIEKNAFKGPVRNPAILNMYHTSHTVDYNIDYII